MDGVKNDSGIWRGYSRIKTKAELGVGGGKDTVVFYLGDGLDDG